LKKAKRCPKIPALKSSKKSVPVGLSKNLEGEELNASLDKEDSN
jgi:hypothetical protein